MVVLNGISITADVTRVQQSLCLVTVYTSPIIEPLIHVVNIHESLCGSFTVFTLSTVGTFNNLYTPVLLSGDV